MPDLNITYLYPIATALIQIICILRTQPTKTIKQLPFLGYTAFFFGSVFLVSYCFKHFIEPLGLGETFRMILVSTGFISLTIAFYWYTKTVIYRLHDANQNKWCTLFLSVPAMVLNFIFIAILIILPTKQKEPYQR